MLRKVVRNLLNGFFVKYHITRRVLQRSPLRIESQPLQLQIIDLWSVLLLLLSSLHALPFDAEEHPYPPAE